MNSCSLSASLDLQHINSSLCGSIIISDSLTNLKVSPRLSSIIPRLHILFSLLSVSVPPLFLPCISYYFSASFSVPWWIAASSWLWGTAVDQNFIFIHLLLPESTLLFSFFSPLFWVRESRTVFPTTLCLSLVSHLSATIRVFKFAPFITLLLNSRLLFDSVLRLLMMNLCCWASFFNKH